MYLSGRLYVFVGKYVSDIIPTLLCIVSVCCCGTCDRCRGPGPGCCGPLAGPGWWPWSWATAIITVHGDFETATPQHTTAPQHHSTTPPQHHSTTAWRWLLSWCCHNQLSSSTPLAPSWRAVLEIHGYYVVNTDWAATALRTGKSRYFSPLPRRLLNESGIRNGRNCSWTTEHGSY